MKYNVDKAAEEWAYNSVKKLITDGVIPADSGTLEIAEYGFLAGAMYERTRRTIDCRRCAELLLKEDHEKPNPLLKGITHDN